MVWSGPSLSANRIIGYYSMYEYEQRPKWYFGRARDELNLHMFEGTFSLDTAHSLFTSELLLCKVDIHNVLCIFQFNKWWRCICWVFWKVLLERILVYLKEFWFTWKNSSLLERILAYMEEFWFTWKNSSSSSSYEASKEASSENYMKRFDSCSEHCAVSMTQYLP